MTIDDFYETKVRVKPPQERFRLAKLVLNDLPDQTVVDVSTEWTDEDIHDFTRGTWLHIDDALEESTSGYGR